MFGNRHHRKGGERLPLLPSHLWSSTSGLHPRGPWGPHEPPSPTHGEHTTGHPSKYSPKVCFTKERPTPIVSPATTLVASGPPMETK